jgi:hypothetical protein
MSTRPSKITRRRYFSFPSLDCFVQRANQVLVPSHEKDPGWRVHREPQHLMILPPAQLLRSFSKMMCFWKVE